MIPTDLTARIAANAVAGPPHGPDAEPWDITIRVAGRPQQAGSKRAFKAGSRVLITDANKLLLPWQQAIRHAAAIALPMGFEPFRVPVFVKASFYFARPQGHYRTGRQAGQCKPDAPYWHAAAPDLDKLCRAVGDALTGVVVADDRLIAGWHAWKRYSDSTEGAIIVVRPSQVSADAAE